MATTPAKRACPVCGTLLPDDSAPCPVCALRLAPETRNDSALAAKAFISHSSKDEAIAEAICQHLESAGVPCWIAPRDIEPGADWIEGILRGIASSRIFVVIFSSHANDSEHVRREVGEGPRSLITEMLASLTTSKLGVVSSVLVLTSLSLAASGSLRFSSFCLRLGIGWPAEDA